MRVLRLSLVCAGLVAVLAAGSVVRAAETTVVEWTPDLVHSRAQFTVAHMVLTKVWGHFPIRQMQIETTGTSLIPVRISAVMDVAHLDTDNHDRDQDLRSPTYFDTAEYPTMSFRSTKIARIDNDDFQLTGDLTVKNVTKSVSFPVHIIGHIADSGGTRVGYEGNLTVDRRDFGITDNRLMQGVLFVGYAVDIGIVAEASSALPYTK